MSNRFKTVLAGASVLALSTLTLSTAMTSQAQAGVDAGPFEGLFVGFNGNFSRVTSKNTYTDLDADSDSFNFFNGIGDSLKGTGYGLNFYGGMGSNIWGPVYASIEGALGVSGGSGNATVNTVIPEHIIPGNTDPDLGDLTDDILVPAEFGTDNLKIRAGFAFDVTARLGYVVDDFAMIYVLGGYTSTKYKSTIGELEFSKSAGGYRVGAGIEVMVMEDIAVRLEYVRTEHSAIDWNLGADAFRLDPRSEVIRLGLVLHME